MEFFREKMKLFLQGKDNFETLTPISPRGDVYFLPSFKVTSEGLSFLYGRDKKNLLFLSVFGQECLEIIRILPRKALYSPANSEREIRTEGELENVHDTLTDGKGRLYVPHRGEQGGRLIGCLDTREKNSKSLLDNLWNVWDEPWGELGGGESVRYFLWPGGKVTGEVGTGDSFRAYKLKNRRKEVFSWVKGRNKMVQEGDFLLTAYKEPTISYDLLIVEVKEGRVVMREIGERREILLVSDFFLEGRKIFSGGKHQGREFFSAETSPYFARSFFSPGAKLCFSCSNHQRKKHAETKVETEGETKVETEAYRGDFYLIREGRIFRARREKGEISPFQELFYSAVRLKTGWRKMDSPSSIFLGKGFSLALSFSEESSKLERVIEDI